MISRDNIWYDMIWIYGMVGYDMTWQGMIRIWYDMILIWCDMIWYDKDMIWLG